MIQRPSTCIEEDMIPVLRNGLMFIEHATNMTVVCLPPGHPALSTPIEKVNFFHNPTQLKGKGKKGANKVTAVTKVCEIKNIDGASHLLRYGVEGTLIEVNSRLLADPELLRRSPTYEGFLAIILYKSTPCESRSFAHVDSAALA